VFGGNGNATATACPSGSTCEVTFHREFSKPVSSDIEMRLCVGQEEEDEEITIRNAEIYVL